MDKQGKITKAIKMVSVILPTYNEAGSVLVIIKKLKKIFRNIRKYSLEIVIADDNSQDLTGQIIKKNFCKDKSVRLFIRKKVKGLGTAIGYGIKKSKGEIVVGMDADGNHPPEKIPLMLEKLKNNDLVIGSRFVKNGGSSDTLRQITSLIFNSILRILGFPIWDNTSGFYAIFRKKLDKLNLDKIYYGYGDYHLRLVYFAKQNGYVIKEVPIYYKKRLGGQSKSKLFNMLINYLSEAFKLCFSRKKS